MVRTQNLNMFSYSSMLSADWEIDSINEAKAAAKHVHTTYPSETVIDDKAISSFVPSLRCNFSLLLPCLSFVER